MVYLAEDFVAPSPDEFEEFEDLLGGRLPVDYRHFLEKCSGARLNYNVELVSPDGEHEVLCFDTTFALESGGDWDTNPFELRAAREAEGFPEEGVLPIARDAGGSVLYLDLRESGRVVAFVHGLPEWTELVRHDSLVEVAPSFQDYLERLFISDDIAELAIEEFDGAECADIAIEAMIEWLDSGNEDWREKLGELWNERVPTRPF
jgi:hypothetical protein